MDELPLVEKPAIQVAREFYKKWSGNNNSFTKELELYVENDFVFIRPDLFMMAKLIDLNGGQGEVEPIWYIRMAVGKLSELIRSLPIFTPEVCFMRHGSLRLRKYPLKRLARFVAHKEENRGKE